MRRSRLALITTVAVGAIAALTLNAVVASGDDGSKHFKLFEHQTEFGFRAVNPNAVSVADTLGISSDLYTNASKETKVGHGDVGCVVSSVARPGGPEAECSFSVMLAGGEISATGLVSFAAATTPGGTFAIPVVGGTGKYRGAKGEISFNVINQTDTWDTFSLS